jgi:hypothetical protein
VADVSSCQLGLMDVTSVKPPLPSIAMTQIVW